MAQMTRKVYVEVAGILAGDLATASTPGEKRKVTGVAYSLADMFKRDNSAFDRQRFYDAVGIVQ